ncbi:MAG: hypothetical protein NXI04_17535 [Planctomycetaceae bacterium]|nr:hypothetical protein [Planctomycetaceae bacterium]
MKIHAICDSCGKTLAVDDIHAGKKIRCPACKSVVKVPQAGMATSAPAAPAAKQRPSTAGSASAPPRKKRPVGGQEPERPRPAKRKRKRPAPAEDDYGYDDLWNDPLVTSGANYDQNPYASSPPPRRRKKKKTRPDGYHDDSADAARSSAGRGGIILKTLLGCVVLMVIAGVGIPMNVEGMTWPAVIVGALLNAYGGLAIMGNAFREDSTVGYMYMFVPFYPLYFLFSRWDENMFPFCMSLVGTLTIMVGIICQIVIGGV